MGTQTTIGTYRPEVNSAQTARYSCDRDAEMGLGMGRACKCKGLGGWERVWRA